MNKETLIKLSTPISIVVLALAIFSTRGSKEITTNLGTALAKGNSCPFGHAYVGEGYCKQVICQLGGRNSPILGGRMWKCSPHFGEDRGNLELGPKVRIGNNRNCPKGEPKIGWNSTCNSPYVEPPKSERIEGRRNYKHGY